VNHNPIRKLLKSKLGELLVLPQIETNMSIKNAEQPCKSQICNNLLNPQMPKWKMIHEKLSTPTNYGNNHDILKILNMPSVEPS